MDGFATFQNRYFRNKNNRSWTTNGSGFFFSNTLYMQGTARDVETDETLGERYFALRDFGDYVSGVLISMDQDFIPIAARVLLVPIGDHTFTKEFLEPTGEVDWEKVLIRRKFEDTILANQKEEYQIRAELQRVFKDQNIKSFNALISNMATTTLQSSPRITESQAALERLREYAFHEELGDIPSFLDQTLARLLNDHVNALETMGGSKRLKEGR